LLGLKPWEYRDYELEDIIDLYDAYVWSLSNSNDNRYMAAISYHIGMVAHFIAQQNAKHPKPYKAEMDDFMFRPKKNLRKEAEKLLLDGENK
jgi:hypothetical protein